MSAEPVFNLSKSNIIRGIQCKKLLYLHVRQPDLESPPDPAQLALFDQGKAVQAAANRSFPGGVSIAVPSFKPQEALEATRKAIAGGALILYEAALAYNGVFIRIDILHRSSIQQPWQIIEVKSAADLKDKHLPDVAIQAWVLRGAGLPLSSASIMHLNRACCFPNLSDLFVIRDVTQAIAPWLEQLPKAITDFRNTLNKSNSPTPDIGPHCSDPYPCPFTDHCWKDKKIPKISIFNIPGLGTERKWKLYGSGHVSLENLPAMKLSAMQERMVDVTRTGHRFIDGTGIRQELAAWRYPFSYLDFETISPAIPRFRGAHPYDQVPFQFSVRLQSQSGAAAQEKAFLHDSSSDPRSPLIDALLSAVGSDGSVVAYNKQFEARCLEDLAEFVGGSKAKALRAIKDRLVDPLPVLRANVYDPAFAGSFSIKAVVPALLGEAAGYGGLTVAEGEAAQRAFEEMISDNTPADRRQTLRDALLAYCGQDTLAMVSLVNWLKDNYSA